MVLTYHTFKATIFFGSDLALIPFISRLQEVATYGWLRIVATYGLRMSYVWVATYGLRMGQSQRLWLVVFPSKAGLLIFVFCLCILYLFFMTTVKAAIMKNTAAGKSVILYGSVVAASLVAPSIGPSQGH